MEIGRASELARAALTQVRHAVVGQDDVLEQALAALLARGHVLLEGVPGTAKTLIVRGIGLAFRVRYQRIQFTPDLMPADVTGVNVFPSAAGEFQFRPGPIFTDVLLADEINRAPAKTQAALLEGMQERQVTTDGVARALPPLFTVFATQNPIEYEGTYPLPEAQLDRFLLKVQVEYPPEEEEREILDRYVGGFDAERVESYGIDPVAGPEELSEMRAATESVRVEPDVRAYITAIVRATRRSPALTLGASPRAGVALFKASRAMALLSARDYVTPDDVKRLARPALRHRVQLAPDLQIEGVAADEAIDGVLEQVPAPR